MYDFVVWCYGVSLSMTALSYRKPAYASACADSCIQGNVKRDAVCYGIDCGFVGAIFSAVDSC